MTEPHELRLKRLYMRAHRRGLKEMDLILGPYAEAMLGAMEPGALDLFERLLDENDQDLLSWITGLAPVPAAFAPQIEAIRTWLATRQAGQNAAQEGASGEFGTT